MNKAAELFPIYCARNRQSGDGGFTLVEVMVALTILSLVMVATVASLRTLGNTQGTIERMTNRVDEVRSVSSLLRDLLDSVVVGHDSGGLSLGGGSSDATYFHWGDGFLEFESTVLFGEGFGGSYLLRIAQEGSKMVLRWQERPVDGIPLEWMDMPSRVMVAQLEEMLVTTRQEYGKDWSSRTDTEGLPPPVLVRLQVKAAGRYWPDLILRVQT